MSPDPGAGLDPALDPAARRRLQSIAYQIVGSSHDAEDAVHEALARWHELTEHERGLVREPLAWLTRVVSRICLDQLGSARVQREQYRGIWLPEPRLGHAETATIDPADQVTLDETVAYALLVAMERLTPAERVSFILHDVFKVPFDEVAATVGRSAAACRQLAVSARRHLEAGPRFDVPSSARDRTVAAFLDACRGGDLQQLAALLDPAVESVADGGDLVRAARRPIVGAVPVATYLLGVLATQKTTTSHPLEFTLEPINGRTGIVIRGGDTVVGTVDLVISDGRISRIAMQVNPEKLQATHD